jgi:hypothetical protein
VHAVEIHERCGGRSNLSDTPVISSNVMRPSARAVLLLILLLQGCASTRTQWQLRRAVAVLEQRSDPDSLAAAAVMLRFTQRPPDEPAAQALIVRAVALAPGRADLAWLEIQQCGLVPGCDPKPEEARLRGLDPSNGVTWINAMTRAGKSGDAAEKMAALSGLAGSERVDVYDTTLTAHLTRSLADTHEVSLPEALVEVIGALAGETTPAFGATYAQCRGEQLNDAAMLPECRRIAAALERGDTWLTEALGMAIARSAWPAESPEWKAAVEARRVHDYRLQLSMHSDMMSLRGRRRAERYLALCAQNRREQDVWLAELIDEGRKPDPAPDWAPGSTVPGTRAP